MIGMTEILALPVLELLLVSLLCGGVGALALLDEKIFFAESVTHGTFPGAVLGVVVAAGLGAGHAALSVALLSGPLLLCLPLGALMRLVLNAFLRLQTIDVFVKIFMFFLNLLLRYLQFLCVSYGTIIALDGSIKANQ